MSSNKNYLYEDINDYSITEKEIIFDATKNSKKIEFGKSKVSQIKANFTKGYYILEVKMNNFLSSSKAKFLHDSNKIIRKITIKWKYHGSIRHIEFTGRCSVYREQHFNNSSYLELILEDKDYISNNRMFTLVGNYFALFELGKKYTYYKSDFKPLSNTQKVFYTAGVVLGIAVTGELILAGSISVMVVVTFIYGVNTVVSCGYDLIANIQGKYDKLGTINLVRDYFWKYVGNGLAKKFNNYSKFNNYNGKEIGDVLYCASEITLGTYGVVSVGKSSINMKAGSLLKRYMNLNVKGAFNNVTGFGTNPSYMRFGYSVSQFVNGSYFVSDYSNSIKKESKEIYVNPTTNPSAISVVK